MPLIVIIKCSTEFILSQCKQLVKKESKVQVKVLDSINRKIRRRKKRLNINNDCPCFNASVAPPRGQRPKQLGTGMRATLHDVLSSAEAPAGEGVRQRQGGGRATVQLETQHISRLRLDG